MQQLHFREFIDQKERQALKHLKVMEKILEAGGFKIENKLDRRSSPYLYIRSPEDDLPFEGVRLYEIGGEMAYRIQKRLDSQPFGRAYSVRVEEMFEDLLGEDEMNDEKRGKEVMEAIIKELKSFFEDSAKAEKQGPGLDDPLNKVYMRTTGGTDYANKVMGNKNN